VQGGSVTIKFENDPPAEGVNKSHGKVVWRNFCDLEQRQPDWNSQADKVARQNNELERAGRLRSA
jgi:hypothetical protein